MPVVARMILFKKEILAYSDLLPNASVTGYSLEVDISWAPSSSDRFTEKLAELCFIREGQVENLKIECFI